MNRHEVRSHLRSDTVAIDTAIVVLGVALAGALARVLVWDPGVAGPPFELSPIPDTTAALAVVGTLLALAATTSALGGGLVPCWWLPFPSLFVAYLHFYTVGGGGFVLVGLAGTASLAVVGAVGLGTLGYLLGAGGRWGHAQFGRDDEQEQPSSARSR